jgi:3-oxoacyl-[acyl-carrier-protein] synthase-1
MYCIAHHILSPLGNGSVANLRAIQAEESALRLYNQHFPSVEPFCASLFDSAKNFIQLCIQSASQAIEDTDIDPSSSTVVFIISTTKGDNLQLLAPAKEVVGHFGNPNSPVVVSNACVSGVSAQIAAWRLLQSGQYNTAIVVGCDVQSQFIVSGFQSFKALSDSPCRPFDEQRTGLNLGEAVATMIYSTERPMKACWQLTAGSMHNDANHISGPSRTGEGSYRCLMDVLQRCNVADISALSVHGTATPYNDEMEAIAIQRADLLELPILAFKGYYGHTMGAAGVLETILSMLALENGILIGNPRYEKCGTSYQLNITKQHRYLSNPPRHFIKMMSGFGGCNAAIRLSYCGYDEL